MKLAMFSLAAAAAFALTTATAQASPQAESLNHSFDRLAPRSSSVSDHAAGHRAIEQVADRGRRYYNNHRGHYHHPHYYHGYRSYPSYRYYNSYPRYYDGYRGRYYNNNRNGFSIQGRNFSFGFGF